MKLTAIASIISNKIVQMNCFRLKVTLSYRSDRWNINGDRNPVSCCGFLATGNG